MRIKLLLINGEVMRHLMMREAIRVLMECPVYWRFNTRERLDMVNYWIFNCGGCVNG